jgi:hypothetical protein
MDPASSIISPPAYPETIGEPPEHVGQEPPSQDEHMPPWQFGQPPM